MRVDGRWHRFQDGVLRPVIDAAVLSSSGVWQNITMLLDCGADGTVFDASLLSFLSPLTSSQTLELGGVGGNAASQVLQTRLAFVRDDENRVTVQGRFSVFADSRKQRCLYSRSRHYQQFPRDLQLSWSSSSFARTTPRI